MTEEGTISPATSRWVDWAGRLTFRFKLALFVNLIIVLLILAKIVLGLAGTGTYITLPVIALCGAAPVLLLSGDRLRIVQRIDWSTLNLGNAAPIKTGHM